LYIDTKMGTVPNTVYSKVIVVELRNHTNEPIYVLSQGFSFGPSIRPSPHGAKNAATGVYEIKFEGREKGCLSDIDMLIRPNQIVTTWIPIDPNQSDESLSEALSTKVRWFPSVKNAENFFTATSIHCNENTSVKNFMPNPALKRDWPLRAFFSAFVPLTILASAVTCVASPLALRSAFQPSTPHSP